MNENNFFRTQVWYPALAPYTWKTLFVKLRDEAVTLLTSGLEDKNVMYSDVAKQVMRDLSEPMGSIPGNAFAFVDNCAPTDTERFFNKGGAVYSPRSALFYLLCSKQVI